MKRLILLSFFAFAFGNTGCNKEPDCRICTGTVTNTGEMANFSVCFEDDVLTQTNNLTGEEMTTENTLPESVAFLESIGLTCSE